MKDTKFTTTMTFNTDKELVRDLRNEFDIGEKEMMSFLIRIAIQHRDELEARVADYKSEVQKVKDLKKADAREAKKVEHEPEQPKMLKVASGSELRSLWAQLKN
jgi:myo-inositol catabolism protein IolC